MQIVADHCTRAIEILILIFRGNNLGLIIYTLLRILFGQTYQATVLISKDNIKVFLWSARIRPCLVELWLWEKVAVGCELWKSCCGLWAVEKLKAVWLNKYKIYLLSLSLLKQLWKSFLFHQFRKAERQKPKAGSNQLKKYTTEKQLLLKNSLQKQSLWLSF